MKIMTAIAAVGLTLAGWGVLARSRRPAPPNWLKLARNFHCARISLRPATGSACIDRAGHLDPAGYGWMNRLPKADQLPLPRRQPRRLPSSSSWTSCSG